MQPTTASEGGVKKLRGDLQETPVNEEGWWKRDVGRVPVDQVFFHKYFRGRAEREEAKKGKLGKRKGKKDEDGSDEGSEDVDNVDESDEEEAEIWKVCLSLRCVLFVRGAHG